MASFVLHSALILGAVAATTRTSARPVDPHPQVSVFYLVPPDRTVPPPPPALGTAFTGPTVGPPTLTISSIVPTEIPPPSTAPFDPLSFSHVTGPGPSSAASDTTTVGARAVYAARWVDDAPVLLSHPAVAYPEILRQAGISGRAVVEAVIDSMGHVERGSIRVLSTTQPLFGQPAADVVAASVYRPGKINGRAVRVRVQVPVDFQVAARVTSM
jgi:protein TonB